MPRSRTFREKIEGLVGIAAWVGLMLWFERGQSFTENLRVLGPVFAYVALSVRASRRPFHDFRQGRPEPRSLSSDDTWWTIDGSAGGQRQPMSDVIAALGRGVPSSGSSRV